MLNRVDQAHWFTVAEDRFCEFGANLTGYEDRLRIDAVSSLGNELIGILVFVTNERSLGVEFFDQDCDGFFEQLSERRC